MQKLEGVFKYGPDYRFEFFAPAPLETSDIVHEAMKNKKTLDEIRKAGLPDRYKEFGSGFIKTV